MVSFDDMIENFNVTFSEQIEVGGGTGAKLDDTLTKKGFAADAKAVGDALEKKLNESDLPKAVDDALAQAKASGEFNGKDGTNGKDGKNGTDGKSAYQIWLADGNIGTEEDFLESLKAPIDDFEEKDPTVPAWAKETEKPKYTAAEVGADATGTADSVVSGHNVNTEAHNDIRLLVSELTKRFNALADSDNIDLDQLSEIITYIQDNRELIDSVTTSKVNYSDIIDNVTTNVSNKPLSAAQGVFLKSLIDAITIPKKLSDLSDDSTHRTVSDAEKTAWNNKSNFSGAYADLTGKPTIPTVPENVSAFTNDSGYVAVIKNTFSNGETLNIPTGYSEYRAAAEITTLTIEYLSADSEAWIKFTTAASGTISINLPDSLVFIGETPTFGNGETWEISIKDGVVVAVKTV